MSDIQRYRLKLKLKEWEVDFHEKNGRKPSKADIAAASVDIQDLYRNYSRMKKQCNVEGKPSGAGPIVTDNAECSFWGEDLNKGKSIKKSSVKISTPEIGKYIEKLQTNNAVLCRQNLSNKTSIQLGSNKAPIKGSRNNKSEDGVAFAGGANLLDAKLDFSFKCNFKIKTKVETLENDRCVKAVNVVSGTDFKLHRRSETRITDKLDNHAEELSIDDCHTFLTSNEIGDTDPVKQQPFEADLRCDANFDHETNVECTDPLVSKKSVTTENYEPAISLVKRSDIVNGRAESSEMQIYKDEEERTGQSKIRKRERSNSLTKITSRPSKIARTSSTSESSRISSNNYVRINLKKRVYSRGKKHFNYRRFKYGKWKQLQREKQPFKENASNDLDASNEEWQSKSNSESQDVHVDDDSGSPLITGTDEDNVVCEEGTLPKSTFSTVEPMFELINDELPPNAMMEVSESLELFGHTELRNWQLKAITRVLAGMSTLVVQPTGAGKSLSYLLPAYMYSRWSSCITLVISPLVALMQDQLMQVPSCLKAACLHSNMTDIQKDKVKESISRGNVNVLFMSPEGLVAGAESAYGYLPTILPQIAFVCIDEVHCISAWSHNFRPAYLRLCRVVREVMKVPCVLGLTATATTSTVENVAHHLGIEVESPSVIRGISLPSNLLLTISRDQGEQAMLALLQEEPFSQCHSIIIYCIRREQTERLATFLRTYFQKDGWSAEAYHAGLSNSRRRAIQNQFMSGHLRVVVATVAFGMGINKADVRAVIHYNMPKCIETYVQEIGRAGRDGQQSFCHVFLDSDGADRQELRRHIYSDSVDHAALAKLLKWTFVPCKCRRLHEMEAWVAIGDDASVHAEEKKWRCPGHEVAFPIDVAVEEMDIKSEAIETLLHYLELHDDQSVKLLNPIYDTCNIFCYGGAEQLRNLTKKWPQIATAASKPKIQNKVQARNSIEFSLVKMASLMGCEVSLLRRRLRKLQWDEVKGLKGETKYLKSGIVVTFRDLSFHLKASGDVTSDEVDDILNVLYSRVLEREKLELEKLENFYSLLLKSSFAHHWECKETVAMSKSTLLINVIVSYFDKASSLSSFVSGLHLIDSKQIDGGRVERISASIRKFLSIYSSEYNFTGRSVARIFHGIGSPRYPAETWGKVREFWRSNLDFDFNMLCKVATELLLQFR